MPEELEGSCTCQHSASKDVLSAGGSQLAQSVRLEAKEISSSLSGGQEPQMKVPVGPLSVDSPWKSPRLVLLGILWWSVDLGLPWHVDASSSQVCNCKTFSFSMGVYLFFFYKVTCPVGLRATPDPVELYLKQLIHDGLFLSNAIFRIAV